MSNELIKSSLVYSQYTNPAIAQLNGSEGVIALQGYQNYFANLNKAPTWFASTPPFVPAGVDLSTIQQPPPLYNDTNILKKSGVNPTGSPGVIPPGSFPGEPNPGPQGSNAVMDKESWLWHGLKLDWLTGQNMALLGGGLILVGLGTWSLLT